MRLQAGEAGVEVGFTSDIPGLVPEFAVFRRSGDAPLYRIEKRPSLQAKQGQWAVIGEGGQILRRGRDLAQALRVFDARKFNVVE